MPLKKHEKNAKDNFLPRRGLSLGWKMTIYMSLIIGIIMGGTTFLQRIIELKHLNDIHENLLRESLTPLAAKLENVSSKYELLQEIEQFHLSYDERGYPKHEIILLNENQEVIFSTIPKKDWRNEKGYFRASMPLLLTALTKRPGTLLVLKDSTEYDRTISRQWIFWMVHVALTLMAIFLFLYPAVNYLVVRPVKDLVKKVKKMEMGYWGKTQIKSGAWEIKWLAWRFENMMTEVRNTMAHLFEAERKAQSLVYLSGTGTEHRHSNNISENIKLSSEKNVNPVYEDLLATCEKLESASLKDPGSLQLAEKVWREDALKADRFGIWDIKSRMENAALRILDPVVFDSLDAKLSEMQEVLKTWTEKNNRELRSTLDLNLIPYINISHRVKHTAGVWKKMQNKDLDLDEIHDLHAYRIIVPTESDCYVALGVIHQKFKPVIGRFKDYIAHPKQNGYQSLHTCVVSEEGPIFEIQIRSAAMHQFSEDGAAAHWVYKKNNGTFLKKTDNISMWSKLLDLVSVRNIYFKI